MLFTVFQYIPILEEEIHASKTMSKKVDNTSNEKDSNSSDDSGDDDENDTDEFLNHFSYHSFDLSVSTSKFNIHKENYLSLIPTINTPPPKI